VHTRYSMSWSLWPQAICRGKGLVKKILPCSRSAVAPSSLLPGCVFPVIPVIWIDFTLCQHFWHISSMSSAFFPTLFIYLFVYLIYIYGYQMGNRYWTLNLKQKTIICILWHSRKCDRGSTVNGCSLHWTRPDKGKLIRGCLPKWLISDIGPFNIKLSSVAI
jgi:hypothetical protein